MDVTPDQLRLALYPDPVLRVKADPITSFDEQLRKVAERMVEIMREEDGIGLAAPQAGLPWRLFVCHVPNTGDEEILRAAQATGLQFWTDEPVACVNPELEGFGDERTPLEEGCLSLPDIRGDVIRPASVKMNALDLEGKPFSIHAGGLLAKCIQHEYDHLDGVLIIDKMSQMSRMKNRTKLRRLKTS